MNRMFVDALYWVAVINPRDQWHARAVEVATNRLTEVLTRDHHFTQEGFIVLL